LKFFKTRLNNGRTEEVVKELGMSKASSYVYPRSKFAFIENSFYLTSEYLTVTVILIVKAVI